MCNKIKSTSKHIRVLLSIVGYFLIASQVLASDVVLNEFLPNPPGSTESKSEWIEIYNTSAVPVNIDGWKLDDDPSSAQAAYIIPSGTIIEAHDFLVFESTLTGIQLSNSGDIVRLLNPEGAEIDTYTYSSTKEDVSIGRSSDGAGTWTDCLTQTKKTSNNCPLPTSSPIPTPSPTSTPKPTKTPTPAPTSLPENTPTPIPSITVSPSPTSTSKVGSRIKSTPIPISSETGSVLSSSHELQVASEEAKTSSSQQSLRPYIITLLFIGFGLASLSMGLVLKHLHQKKRS